jgi:hypothetical protein
MSEHDERPRSDEPGRDVPEPGHAAAPDGTSQGMEPAVASDSGETVTHLEQSSVGPGAGESEVVKVTSPVQHEDDEVTSHPTLRDDRKAEEGRPQR